MTNTRLLKNKIKKSGYRNNYLAEKLNLSETGFSLKVNNKNKFYVDEMYKLSRILKITNEEKEKIFFDLDVDKKSTNKNEM